MEAALSWLDDELMALDAAENAMNDVHDVKTTWPDLEIGPVKPVTNEVTGSQPRDLPTKTSITVNGKATKPLTDVNENQNKSTTVIETCEIPEIPFDKPEPKNPAPVEEKNPTPEEATKPLFPTLQLNIEDNSNTPNILLSLSGSEMAHQSISSSTPLATSTTSTDAVRSKEDELEYYTRSLLDKMNSPGDKDMYGYCEKCNGIVEGEKTGCKALDTIYHIDCFRCKTCNKLLHGTQFYVVEKDTFCEACYMNSLEKCTICSEVITERILRATGKPYHPACFKCVVCGKCLDGIPFTVDVTNQIHCIEDFHQKFAPKCSVCQNPIMPEAGQEETVRIVALDRSFHVNCYKCEKCGTKLTSEREGRGCFPLDGHILCRDCNTAMVQQIV